MAGSLGTLAVRLNAETRGFTRQFAEAERAVNTFSNRAKSMGTAMNHLGSRLTVGLTLPLVAMGTVAVRNLSKFQLEMTRSLAIMGDLSDTMRNKMTKTAEDLAVKWNIAADSMAKGYYYLASAGLDAEQSLIALPGIAQFAKAGAFDLAEATELAGDALSAFGLKSKNTEEMQKNLVMITDKLVRVNTLADASTRQFAVALTSGAAAAAKNFGVSLDETLAVLAAYAEQGIKAEEAGNMFSRMLRLLSQSIVKNSTELEEMGVQLLDDNDNFKNMAEIAGALGDALNNLSVEEKAAALSALGFQARTQQAVFPLLHMKESLQAFQEKLAVASGFTENVANKQMKTLAERMGQAHQEIMRTARGMAEQLVPALEAIEVKIVALAKWIEGLTEQQRLNLVKWVVFAASLGPILKVLGALTTAVGFIAPRMALMGVRVFAASASLKVLAASAPLATKALSALLGVGLSMAAVYGAIKLTQFIKEVWNLNKATTALRDSMSDLASAEKVMFERFGTANTTVLRNIREALLNDNQQIIDYYEKRFPKAVNEARAALDKAPGLNVASPGSADALGNGDLESELEEKRRALGEIEKQYNDQVNAAKLDQLKIEDRMYELVNKRYELEDQIAKAKGEHKFDLQTKALAVEQQLIEGVLEIRDNLNSLNNSPTNAGAVEAGSAAAYSSELAGQRNELLQITRNGARANDLLQNTLSEVRRVITILDKDNGPLEEVPQLDG